MENKFVAAAKAEENKTLTENGHFAYKSTTDKLLDLFSTIGSLREADRERVCRLFDEAYSEDPLLATKCLFYSRDIREGLGERKTFRTLLIHNATYHPECIEPDLDLIGVFGRYDDLYSLIGTPLEDNMWEEMKKQFLEDLDNLENGNVVSLLAKWIKTPDASSEKTRALGILTAKKLGYSVYDFKRLLRKLRKKINIVEAHMCAKEWDQIKYSEVPSRAMFIYKNAFMRHDEENFNNFINKAINGEVKINSSTLYPYDLVKPYLLENEWGYDDITEVAEKTYEAQWRALPNYIEGENNVIVMADVSGSMTSNKCQPLASSIGLAMYFAERNHGAFKNLYMTFSEQPHFVNVKGDTLRSKIDCISHEDIGYNTDMVAAFEFLLNTAINGKVPAEDMPKTIIAISDMEIDTATTGFARNFKSDFYDEVKDLYEEAGYEVPVLIFWNVNSRHDTFLVDNKRKNVLLCSGSSTTTFKYILNSIGMTANEMMLKVLNSERYEAITILDK